MNVPEEQIFSVIRYYSVSKCSELVYTELAMHEKTV